MRRGPRRSIIEGALEGFAQRFRETEARTEAPATMAPRVGGGGSGHRAAASVHGPTRAAPDAQTQQVPAGGTGAPGTRTRGCHMPYTDFRERQHEASQWGAMGSGADYDRVAKGDLDRVAITGPRTGPGVDGCGFRDGLQRDESAGAAQDGDVHELEQDQLGSARVMLLAGGGRDSGVLREVRAVLQVLTAEKRSWTSEQWQFQILGAEITGH